MTSLVGLFTNHVDVTVSPTIVEVRCRDLLISIPAKLHVTTNGEPPRVVGVGDQVQADIPSRPVAVFGPREDVGLNWSRERQLATFFAAALARLGDAGPFAIRPTVQIHGVSSVAGVLGAHADAVISSALELAGVWKSEVID